MESTDVSENWFDDDIAAMNLGYGEKAGLQIYRNYTKAFENDAIKRFVETIDREDLDLSDLKRIANLIASEEARFLPVIVCAFADDIFKETYKYVLPNGIPGGKGSMLSGFGPLADLSKRIQLAYAFDIFSNDLMEELNRLRETRNDIAHSWNLNELGDYFTKGRPADMYRMEELLPEHATLASEFGGGFSPLAGFRVRLVWIVGRLVYEAATYNRAKNVHLRPSRVLYGKPTPKWLSEIAKICLSTTREIAAHDI